MAYYIMSWSVPFVKKRKNELVNHFLESNVIIDSSKNIL